MSEAVDSKESVVKQAKDESLLALGALGTSHSFEMAGECKDKDGNATKVFTIDTDKRGILRLKRLYGNPLTFPSDEGGKFEVNVESFQRFYEHMSNIELTEDNEEAIGDAALSQAYEVVHDFFTFCLVRDKRFA